MATELHQQCLICPVSRHLKQTVKHAVWAVQKGEGHYPYLWRDTTKPRGITVNSSKISGIPIPHPNLRTKRNGKPQTSSGCACFRVPIFLWFLKGTHEEHQQLLPNVGVPHKNNTPIWPSCTSPCWASLRNGKGMGAIDCKHLP